MKCSLTGLDSGCCDSVPGKPWHGPWLLELSALCATRAALVSQSVVQRVSFHAAKSVMSIARRLSGHNRRLGSGMAATAQPLNGKRLVVAKVVMSVKMFRFGWTFAAFAITRLHDLAKTNRVSQALTRKPLRAVSVIANSTRLVLLGSASVVVLLKGTLAPFAHATAESILGPLFTKAAITACLHDAESVRSLP